MKVKPHLLLFNDELIHNDTIPLSATSYQIHCIVHMTTHNRPLICLIICPHQLVIFELLIAYYFCFVDNFSGIMLLFRFLQLFSDFYYLNLPLFSLISCKTLQQNYVASCLTHINIALMLHCCFIGLKIEHGYTCLYD